MNPIISVIIPVYNTRDILIDTVDSIIKQTFEDFELILIDDGSENYSNKLCDIIAKKDKRIRVIHKENGGVCEARNVGLEVARGKYITFCDHDDLYYPETLKVEYEEAIKANADMVIVGVKNVLKESETISGTQFIYVDEEVRSHFLDILTLKCLNNVWNVLYKRDLIENIKFDTNLKHGEEDIIFNLSIIKKVNKIVSICTPLYKHIVREGMSISSKIYKETVPALIQVNNLIYTLTKEFYNNEIISYQNQYICVQGEYLKCCTVYLVKAGGNYKDFLDVIQQISFYKFDHLFKAKGINIKSYFVYYCLCKGRNRLLFKIINCFVKVKNNL